MFSVHCTLSAMPSAQEAAHIYVVISAFAWMCRAGGGEGFAVTPFAAGHLLGGALWRLTTRDEEHIVYAAAYNHRKVCSEPARLPRASNAC